jgi:hypothetical protein
VPEEVATLLERLLAKAPADRFATPAELAAALAPFAAGCDLPRLVREGGPAAESLAETVAYSPDAPTSRRRPRRRRPTLVRLAGRGRGGGRVAVRRELVRAARRRPPRPGRTAADARPFEELCRFLADRGGADRVHAVAFPVEGTAARDEGAEK